MAEVHPDQRRLLQGVGATARRSRPAWPWLWLAAALVAALIRAIAPVENGIWLVAYLLLVGFMAQSLLEGGQSRLLGPLDPRSARSRAQPGLWNAGVVLVPCGVFLDARLLIVLGGCSLLAALTAYSTLGRHTRGLGARRPVLRAAYVALIVALAASAFVGMGLGWHRPWLS